MKRLRFHLLAVIILVNLTGCISKPVLTEKMGDLEFEVLSEEEIPEELLENIEKAKQRAFRMTYEDEGVLYITEGYGKQEHTGYSVEVTDVYESQNAICFHTSLLGPEKNEEVKEIATFPYVVIKLEAIGKEVVFE